MAQVDFYIIPDAGVESRNRFACRLLDKAYQQGEKCFLLCANAEEAEQLDNLLWTFRDISFVPHAHVDRPVDGDPAVTVGYQALPEDTDQVLVNFSDPIPEKFSEFKRVIEIVPEDPALKKQSRAHFKFYRDNGVEPNTIKI